MSRFTFLIAGLLFPLSQIIARPYFDPSRVPKDNRFFHSLSENSLTAINSEGIPVLRVDIDWNSSDESYSVSRLEIEPSGTDALLRRAKIADPLGSYKAKLIQSNGEVQAHASVGTGRMYRRLVRTLSFRFPIPATEDFKILFDAENPNTGKMQTVLTSNHNISELIRYSPQNVDTRLVRAAKSNDKLRVTIYSEGYAAGTSDSFFEVARRVAQVFSRYGEKAFDHFEIVAAFAPSQQSLQTPRRLGFPIPERNSFLGLYFPYWNDVGRWYHVVYPTREERLRRAFASAAYDYPIAVIDSNQYWGVGNFNAFTAIPSEGDSFTYLLMHEFGHFLGLNEEYEGGGPTELEFAPQIHEPWSQNITFLNDPQNLKWKDLVPTGTAIPTPASDWMGSGPIGAYRGGYAQSQPLGKSHKPGLACTMGSGRSFCSVCSNAMSMRIERDLAKN